MKKGLRNLALIVGIALPVGVYTSKEYKAYSTPQTISVEKEDGFKIKTYRHDSNLFFETAEKLLGVYNRDSYTREGLETQEINIDITVPEREAPFIERHWDEYLKNNSYALGDHRWDKQMQAVYNALRGVDAQNIKNAYLESTISSTKVHEKVHGSSMRTALKDMHKTPLQKELEAYSFELTKSPFVLGDLEGLVKDKKDSASKQAAEIILRELYGDDPWSFYHSPDFNKEVETRAKKIFEKVSKN